MQEPQPTFFEVNGDAIREERMQAGIEISHLAKRAGISRRYLSHLENGTRRRMGPSRYVALRTALNSSDARLLTPTEEHPRTKGSDHAPPEDDPRRP